ncbi:hypothetical protein FSP39_022795 [Pinctada imbricata]|uniref:Uncharacterized protein n=1 Tax=Pinctada imbricata TaxID=66713 RepID=A0AA88XPF4_PINIB|nr:hypothetical protein FSP39_022795 [Pinctada imbricata]
MTIPLPNTTSEWSQGHLDVLNIHQKFLVKPEPSDFISMSYMKGIIMPTQKALEYVYWKSNDLLVQEITRCMSMALDNITLNFESVDDIPIEVPDELKNGLRVWKKDFLKTLQTQKLRTDQVDMIETFCWQ